MTSAANPAVATFVQEARELLEGLEERLLELENEPDQEQVDAVFRTLHTVKGSGSMFGFTTLARFTHHFENAYDLVREGKLTINRALIDLSLLARDHMTALLDCGGDTPEAAVIEASAEAAKLVAALHRLTGGGIDDGVPAASAVVTEAPPTLASRYDIWFKPAPDDLRNGVRPDLLIEELRGLGELVVQVDIMAVPPLATLDAEQNYTGYRIELTTAQSRGAIESVFIFADDAELDIHEIVDPVAAAAQAVLDVPGRPAEAASVDVAPRQQLQRARDEVAGENVRVPAVRLDEMMDRLGELVIAQARLDQISSRIGDTQLESVVEEIERLVTGLRDATLSIRMLPIEVVFSKFRRVVRDLSADLGKDVRGGRKISTSLQPC
jgi:two-component system chemotaxis sensor kinase CheA